MKNGDGSWRLGKFINSFDYSLDFIKLCEICPDFLFTDGKKQYTKEIINVTFKYAYKEFNQIRRGVWVRAGYDYAKIQFVDGVCIQENVLIGIETDIPVTQFVQSELLPSYFGIEKDHYVKLREPKVLLNRSEIRLDLYEHGFWAEGIHYVRMKRSSGSARVGKCLFINEEYYKELHTWEMCGLDVKKGDPVDLAALESYISLSTSSIISTIEIDPRSILIIDDYDSVFEEEVVNVVDKDGHLEARREKIQIKNSIWDGESLADSSLFPEGSRWGMMLLRNQFFKSCCFNTNLTQWFKDQGITEISQLKGFTLAEKIEDVKLITTPNSIKYLKFGDAETWLNHISSTFGVVKHEKRTHYLDGMAVQTHYQLLNTLQLSEEKMREFLTPSLEFAQALKSDPAVVRYFIKFPAEKEYNPIPMLTAEDVVFNMMCVNDRFTATKYYQSFTVDLLRAYYGNLKCGHVLVNGNYSTLVGNPFEMLKAAIGRFDGKSELGVGNVYSKRFGVDKTILCSRSPHVAAGNILLVQNVGNEDIDKYFNFTKEIIVINSIGENILNRLSGAD